MKDIYNEVLEMVEQSANTDSAELEALFYQSNLQGLGNQKRVPNRKTFERAIAMMRDYNYTESVTEQLDINIKNYRVSVYQDDNIDNIVKKIRYIQI